MRKFIYPISGITAIILFIFLGQECERSQTQDYLDKMNVDSKEHMEESQEETQVLIKAYQGQPGYATIHDLLSKYKIVENNGDIEESYKIAGQIASAYLDVHDEDSYKKWKSKENKLKEDL